MNADELAERAASFAEGASDYERLRPEFPERLFDDLAARAGERLAGRVLEVGAGTGLATVPLARRGATIEVVEPSADMLRVLGERLRTEGLADRVTPRRAAFEDVDAASGYDVVVAAQSFHWTDPGSRWTRLAGLLGAGGIAFLFWNGWQFDGARHDAAAVRAVYASHGGGLASDLDDHRSTAGWAEREIEAHPGLTLSHSEVYRWDHSLPVEDYLGLLATTSQYATAPATVRERLFGPLARTLGPTTYLNGSTLLLVVEPAGAGYPS